MEVEWIYYTLSSTYCTYTYICTYMSVYVYTYAAPQSPIQATYVCVYYLYQSTHYDIVRMHCTCVHAYVHMWIDRISLTMCTDAIYVVTSKPDEADLWFIVNALNLQRSAHCVHVSLPLSLRLRASGGPASPFPASSSNGTPAAS